MDMFSNKSFQIAILGKNVFLKSPLFGKSFTWDRKYESF